MQEQTDREETKERLDHLDLLVQEVILVQLDHQEHQEQLALQGHAVIPDPQEHRVK